MKQKKMIKLSSDSENANVYKNKWSKQKKQNPEIPPAWFLAGARSFPSFPLKNEETQLGTNKTFRPGQELQTLKRIRAHLRRINKPTIKTIQSPDGDLIDCVLSNLQPAFDHPELKRQKPLALEFYFLRKF
ncbi:hypothetical protein NE237_012679 [Protea cynaroides]|uniref:Neprosin activation peptide domain-containing protein n=1 Tax=Protea cynaroides TaxID=273540 RepID=A0A9Q0GX80_9MAGN|nr:hypothetical protein NE237_012679 [Protea cynaroides]